MFNCSPSQIWLLLTAVCSLLSQDFIIKYRKLVKDIGDVRCASVHGDENSLAQVSIAVKLIDLYIFL
jgi:hypothetical protein